jgi:hypothetical protein
MTVLQSWLVFVGVALGGAALAVYVLDCILRTIEEWRWRRAVDAAALDPWIRRPSGEKTPPEANEAVKTGIVEG